MSFQSSIKEISAWETKKIKLIWKKKFLSSIMKGNVPILFCDHLVLWLAWVQQLYDTPYYTISNIFWKSIKFLEEIAIQAWRMLKYPFIRLWSHQLNNVRYLACIIIWLDCIWRILKSRQCCNTCNENTKKFSNKD